MSKRNYNDILKSIEEIRSDIIKEPNSSKVNDKYQKIEELVKELKSDNYDYEKVSLEKIKSEKAKANTKEDYLELSNQLENKKYYMENKDLIESLPLKYKDVNDLFILRKLYDKKVDKKAFKFAIVTGVSILALATGLSIVDLNKKSRKKERSTTEITTEFVTEEKNREEEIRTNDLQKENLDENTDIIDLENNKSKNDEEIDNLLNKWRKEEKSTTESNTNVNTNTNNTTTNTNQNTNTNTNSNNNNTKKEEKEDNKKNDTSKKNDNKKKDKKKKTTSDKKEIKEETPTTTEDRSYIKTETVIVPEVTTEAPKIIESTEAEVKTTEMNEEEIRKLFEKVTTEEKKEKKTEERENTYDIDEKDIQYHSESLNNKSKVLVYFNI